MVTLDWQLRRAGEATLVELVVQSDVDARVEIASNLEPVWPPRRRNRAVAGWTETGFEGVVPADEALVLGYASPAAPVEPPATLVDAEPVTDRSDDPPTADGLVRALGEAAPPRDAVPADGTTTAGDTPETAATSTAVPDPPSESGMATGPRPGPDASLSGDSGTGEGGTSETGTAGGTASDRTDGTDSSGEMGPPDPDAVGGGRSDRPRQSGTGGAAVDAWLDGVEWRLETADSVAAADTPEEIRAAVDAAGGIDTVRRVRAQLETDHERLDRIERLTGGVGDRLAAVDASLSALERPK